MKRILSYFTIFLINFIACSYLQASDPDYRPPAPPSSPVDMALINHRPVIATRELSTPHNPSEGTHGSEVEHATEGTASDIPSEHQERVNALRKQSMIVNKPTKPKKMPREQIINPWNFKLTGQHLEYVGGIVTAISLVTLFMTSGNNSQTTRSGMPTDAIGVGYQVGATAFSIISSLGLKGIVCAGGLYGGYKIKRWIHAGCRSDLQKAKDEFENLLNEHIEEDNARLIEATKKDANMCDAFDGLVTALTLTTQQNARTTTFLVKMLRVLPSEQQTIFLHRLTADEQGLFNTQMGNLTAEQLAETQSNQISNLSPRLIASRPTHHPIIAIPGSMPNRPPSNIIDAETDRINQILHNVHGITQGVRKDNEETLNRPLPTKVPKPTGCCGGRCSIQ